MRKKNKWLVTAVVLTISILSAAVFLAPGKDNSLSPLFLPGIYVCQAQNEFCRISDTLVISRTKTVADYTLTRSTWFIRIRAGKEEPPELQKQSWIGRYERGDSWLVPVQNGDTVRYIPEKNQVSQSDFYYQKIE